MGDDRPLPQYWSVFTRFILHRLNANRDAKIIITGKGGSTGTGKTTAAICVARWIQQIQACGDCSYLNEPNANVCRQCGSSTLDDQQGDWYADQHGFLDPWEYMEYYSNESEKGEALILDESEYSIHRRRSMSGENVSMTRVWSALRYKECVSILTLPSTDLVDSMMKQLGDLWFNVVKRGVIYPHVYWYNDYTGKVAPYRLKLENGIQTKIRFPALDGDSEYEKMAEAKDVYVTGSDAEHYDEDDLREAKEKAAEDATVHYRIDLTENILEHTDWKQVKVGEIVHPDPDDQMSGQWVSKVNRGVLGYQDGDHYPIR